jgi:hypothetical protein
MELMKELVAAFSNDNWEKRYYLDIETGKVVVDLDEALFDEPESEWDENTNIDRYLQIPRATSSDNHHLMQQFIKEVKDKEAQETLSGMLEHTEFEQFKKKLSEFDLSDRWTAFEVEYYQEQISDWLDIEELSYDELNEKSVQR